MTDLELKKKKLELLRVTAGKQELEIRIDEIAAEIDRLKENIEIQKKKEKELSQLISENSK